jgi:fatty-acyl-CoA synthase
MNSKYDEGLAKNEANYVPLTPLSFLVRAASAFPNRVAIVQGDIRRVWAETYLRCCRLASALKRAGVERGDTVAVIGANTVEMFEAHFGIPMVGAVINAINTRLDATTVARILEHAEAKVLLADREFSRTVAPALALMESPPQVVDIVDESVHVGELLGAMDYDAFLSTGDPDVSWNAPLDEWDAIALTYTSGTTAMPKGVVYHHRGAYLNALGNLIACDVGLKPVYLWTLPMFHCNGWCFPWTLAAVGGTSICLRSVRAEPILQLIEKEHVTQLCGAPVVLSTICQAAEQPGCRPGHSVKVVTGGSAPSAALLERMEALGFEVIHVYGLTETYGPATASIRDEAWDDLSANGRALMKARQGVPFVSVEALIVAAPATRKPVPKDGTTIGEVFVRSNTVMKGYLKDAALTEESFDGGWFRTSDLAVWHPDGWIEIKDRSKDIIISGGENISSLEVEAVLCNHLAVLEAAVVARPDPKWGESPCAFVALRPDMDVSERDIISFCRQRLAHYKVPKSVVYGPLPRNAAGKVQKGVLRERAKSLTLLV